MPSGGLDTTLTGGRTRARRKAMAPCDRFGAILDHPVLPRAEQIDLIRESRAAEALSWEGWAADPTPARHRLAASSTRLVVWEASRIARRFGLPIDEAFSDGCTGLMDAIDSFDTEYGTMFSTYLAIGVRMRCTRKAPPRPEPASLDAPTWPGGPPLSGSIPASDSAEPTVDEAADHERETAAAAELAPLLAVLGDRERLVVASRFGLDGHARTTLEAIGADLGVTKERARQICEAALARMRRAAGVALAPAESPPGEKLSPREASVLAAIRSLPRTPSLDDVARLAGLARRRDAAEVARRLKSKGLTDWAPRARGEDAA